MNATPVLEHCTRKTLSPRALSEDVCEVVLGSGLTAMDEERRDVLESVRSALRQKSREPARRAACRFLLQHLSRSRF